MSMMCHLADLSPGQLAAFCEQPGLASDFTKNSVGDQFDARIQAGLARLPPELRQQYQQKYEQSRRDLMAKVPSMAGQGAELDAARPLLAKLGPFEPLMELGKAWHILHYLMTGHSDAAEAPGNALLSGTPLGEDLGYGPARLHDPDATRAFRDFLAPLESVRLLARLDFPLIVQLRVYPFFAVPDTAEAQSWRDEIATAFLALKSYVGRAAERGDGLLVWLS
jgi:hypothetical protein